MIRKRMQEIREELSGDQQAKKSIDKMLKQMEETETDKSKYYKTNSFKATGNIKQTNRNRKAHEREKDQQRQSSEWLQEITNRIINPFEEYQKKENKESF